MASDHQGLIRPPATSLKLLVSVGFRARPLAAWPDLAGPVSRHTISQKANDKNNEYDKYETDTFIDKIELDNSKLTLKIGMQYKIPEPNVVIGLNLNYDKTVDHLKTEQDNPIFKAKLAIKFGF